MNLSDYLWTFVWLSIFFQFTDCRKNRRSKRGNGKCGSDTLVEYNLSFFGDWSKETFPRMYPKYRPHAQWSKLFGITHGSSYKMWSEGEVASLAMRKFVEERNTLLFDKLAQGFNDTYDIFSTAPIRGGMGRSSAVIFANGKHSKVSFVVKLIPSPDWFVGVDGLDLCRNGRWRRKVYAHLRPLDAGTDKGLTYTSPNWPSHPAQRIFEITPSYPDHPASSFFYPEKSRLPRIAHAIFEKVTEYQQRGRVTNVRYNSSPNVEVQKQPHEILDKTGRTDEEDIDLDAKLDQAIVDKLESDIQARLKSAPRRTMFLQKMLRHGGKPLMADQSSEEADEITHGDVSKAKSADAFLRRMEPSVVLTTQKNTPSAITTTVYPYVDSFERADGLETVRWPAAGESRSLVSDISIRRPLYPAEQEANNKNGVRVVLEDSSEEADLNKGHGYYSEARRVEGHADYKSNTYDEENDHGAVYDVETTTKLIDRSYDSRIKGEAVVDEYAAAYYENQQERDEDIRYTDARDRSDNAEPERNHGHIQNPTASYNYNVVDQHSKVNERNNNDDDDDVDNNDENEDDDRSDVDNDNVDNYHDNVEPKTDRSKSIESFIYGIEDRQHQINYEELDCMVAEWTEWSPCSKTCGFGVKTRSRDIIQHNQNGGEICPRISVQVLCGSMRTCKWNHFSSLFGRPTQQTRRRRRRRRRHHHGAEYDNTT